MAGLAVGALLVPGLVHLGGSRLALLGVAAVLPLAAAAGGRALFGLDSGTPVPVVQIALLRSLPLFAELPAPPLEGLAGALTPVTVPAGTELIRQGDPGDAYYAIAAGELDATQDGHFLRRCGRGEGVGEIALLRDIPRTATVTAHTDATVYKLDRDPFLTAVLGHAPTQRQADRIAGDPARHRRRTGQQRHRGTTPPGAGLNGTGTASEAASQPGAFQASYLPGLRGVRAFGAASSGLHAGHTPTPPGSASSSAPRACSTPPNWRAATPPGRASTQSRSARPPRGRRPRGSCWNRTSTRWSASVVRVLQTISTWTASPGTTIHQFVVRIDGEGGFAVVESDNPADLAGTIFKFATILECTVYPVIDVDEGLRVARSRGAR